MEEDLRHFYQFWLGYYSGSQKVSVIHAHYYARYQKNISTVKVGRMLAELKELGYADTQMSDGVRYWYRLDLLDKAKRENANSRSVMDEFVD